jgi:hypothetical protein
VPLSTVLLLRRLSVGSDALVPSNLSDDICALRNPELRKLLALDETGTWSLCARSVDFLEEQIRKHRPQTILEFGGGLSTVCLARIMQDIHGPGDRILVCSVEQNRSVVEATLRRLAQVQLDRHVRFVTAPLVRKRIVDREVSCYAISNDDMAEIATLRPDMVLVDGPAAESGARFGTLPLVRGAISPDARVYLDDAFRDGELGIAKSWPTVFGMEVEGVLPTKKGFLVGRLTGTRD